MNADALVLSKRAAARLLGIGRSNTLEEMIADGQIKVVSIRGKVRIPREEIERIAREGTELIEVAVDRPRRKKHRPKDIDEAIDAIDPWATVDD